jgi:hypothetical protein
MSEVLDEVGKENLLAMLREEAASGSHGGFEIHPECVEFVLANCPDNLAIERLDELGEEGFVRFSWASVRRCNVCGADAAADRPDACFGMLPGVVEACCGHGDKRKAYIHFDSGLIIRGFTLQHRSNKWGERVA